MQNARLDGAQAGIKIAGESVNNLRYADDTTHVAENEEELKSLLMKVREESEKVGLKLNMQKSKIVASGPITSWQREGETMETVTDFILGGAPKSMQMVTAAMELKKCLLLGRKAMTNLVQFSSVAQSCLTLCDPMNHSTPGLPVHHQLRSSLRLTSIESVMPSSHLFLCRPLLLLPPIPPSIRVFSNESTLRMRWPSTGVSALASFLPKKSQG